MGPTWSHCAHRRAPSPRRRLRQTPPVLLALTVRNPPSPGPPSCRRSPMRAYPDPHIRDGCGLHTFTATADCHCDPSSTDARRSSGANNFGSRAPVSNARQHAIQDSEIGTMIHRLHPPPGDRDMLTPRPPPPPLPLNYKPAHRQQYQLKTYTHPPHT